MATHTIDTTLTDAAEKAWAYVLASHFTDDTRPADVDALMALRLDELTQGALSTFHQRPEQVALETAVVDKLRTGSEQDVAAIAVAAKVDVPTKGDGLAEAIEVKK